MRLLRIGFHTLIKNASFFSPTNVESHIIFENCKKKKKKKGKLCNQMEEMWIFFESNEYLEQIHEIQEDKIM